MSRFGIVDEYVTPLGCEVLRTRTVAKRQNVLTPVDHIILWVPEKKLDKPKKPL